MNSEKKIEWVCVSVIMTKRYGRFYQKFAHKFVGTKSLSSLLAGTFAESVSQNGVHFKYFMNDVSLTVLHTFLFCDTIGTIIFV